MSRNLGDWLTAYLEYVDNTEPPLSYHTWVGLWSIAAALQRRCWLPWGHEKIFPNLYVVLVGSSGKTRKGTALNLGRGLITGAGINCVAESTSRQALIRKMKNASASYTDPDTETITVHCSLSCISAELTVFLGESETRFLADLTDWYDSSDIWRYETIARGEEHIEGVCFNLLGATAPDWLEKVLPQAAIGGGFTSRVIFVVEERKRKSVPEHELTEREYQLQADLTHDLEVISTMCGRFTMAPDARQFYTEWYTKLGADLEAGRQAVNDPRFAGYNERRATHLRKVSMIFSASRSNSRLIQLVDIKRALAALEMIEKKMPRVFGGLGEARYSVVTQKVMDYIKDRKQVPRSELLAAFYLDLDTFVLSIVEKVLITMKVVRLSRTVNDSEVIYHWIGD